jgi:hypothetical protein
MRPVNGTNSNSEKQPGDANKEDLKRGAEKSRKTRHDIDSSDESRSEESLREGGKKAPNMKSKQPPKNKDKEVRVAPNSTTYSPPSSIDPSVRSFSKREAFQGRVKREKEIGKQHWHRRCEADLKENFPELESLKSAQRKKELVDKSKAAGGHLKVELKNRKDVDLLVAVLNENPSIRSLKLVCDFGGNSSDDDDFERNSNQVDFTKSFRKVLQDQGSLASILSACKSINALDLRGCRLNEASWVELANHLYSDSSIACLTLGGNDRIYNLESKILSGALRYGSSSLRELIIDDLAIGVYSFESLLMGIKEHKKLSLIRLENIHDSSSVHMILNFYFIFRLCANNPNLQYLSLSGTKFRQLSPGKYDLNISMALGSSLSDHALAFKDHECLQVLDLTHCDLIQEDMDELMVAIQGHKSLIEIRTDGNNISNTQRTSLNELEDENRRLLEERAAAAIDLLVRHGSNDIDTWPRELSNVMAENTPVMVLNAIASLIGKDAQAEPDKGDPDTLKSSESDT